MNNWAKPWRDVSLWLFCKWSCMVVAIFWIAIYKLSESGTKLQGFVYVNF